jgi:hypothetical protein
MPMSGTAVTLPGIVIREPALVYFTRRRRRPNGAVVTVTYSANTSTQGAQRSHVRMGDERKPIRTVPARRL